MSDKQPTREVPSSGIKVVFLDFDGVLNTHAYLQDLLTNNQGVSLPDNADLDPYHVERLNRLIRETDARVVISSSWRHGRTLATLREMLEARGFKGIVIGRTPDYVPNRDPLSKHHTGERGDEIHAWLECAPLYDIEIEQFVILDDDPHMTHVSDRLVQTALQTGLLDWHVDKAIELLRQPKSQLVIPSPAMVINFVP